MCISSAGISTELYIKQPHCNVSADLDVDNMDTNTYADYSILFFYHELKIIKLSIERSKVLPVEWNCFTLALN